MFNDGAEEYPLEFIRKNKLLCFEDILLTTLLDG
jgi:hypothetical protein